MHMRRRTIKISFTLVNRQKYNINENVVQLYVELFFVCVCGLVLLLQDDAYAPRRRRRRRRRCDLNCIT